MNAARSLLHAALFLCGLLLSVSAGAQLRGEAGAISDQQAGLARQDEQFRQAGWQVMYMMDFGQMGDIWDHASQIMKDLVRREEFVRQIVTERVRLGAIVERKRPEITRSASDGRDSTPKGLYINVSTTSRFMHHPQPVQELVSFRLDEDGVWRVTGYSVQ